MAHRINVRAVAEFYCEGGDLSRESDLYARMQEGSRVHRALQSEYPDGYRAEVPVSRTVECLGIEFALYGRVDGLWRRGDEPVIEEIKSTLREVTSLTGGEYPAHWAQAQLYAAILCHQEQANGAWVHLVYCQAGTMQTTRLERHYTADELESLLQTCLEPLARWTGALNAHREARLPTLRALTFPYDRFRAGQREMAANVYVALRDRKRLLCQAPTGIGKTVASLFPSLKALGEEKAEAVFYLTARTTGARAVLDALERMRRQGAHVRTVFLHELFPDAHDVPDSALVPLVREACPGFAAACGAERGPRAWYYALLDYGAFLKQTLPNPSRRSRTHARQSRFEGSHRQKRAELVRVLLDARRLGVALTRDDLARELDAVEVAAGRPPVDGDELDRILAELEREGFCARDGEAYRA